MKVWSRKHPANTCTQLCSLYWSNIYNSLCSNLGEGNGNPLQYSCLVAESRTQLSDFTFTFYFHALEKEMATHSSVLAWRIPGIGEPGGLPSLGSHRVGHDWSDLAAAAEAVLKSTVNVKSRAACHAADCHDSQNDGRDRKRMTFQRRALKQ